MDLGTSNHVCELQFPSFTCESRRVATNIMSLFETCVVHRKVIGRAKNERAESRSERRQTQPVISKPRERQLNRLLV
jgi:hypothetical protein